jgi:hypothetical protein
MFDHDADPAEILKKSCRSSVFAYITANLVLC